MINRYRVSVLLFSFLLSISAISEGFIRVTPYLQNTTGTSVSILCITTESVSGKVKLMMPKSSSTKSAKVEVTAIPNTSLYRCIARFKNLHPGKVYKYSMMIKSNSGQKYQSKLAPFRTLNPRAETCRFSVISDIHNAVATHAAYMERLKSSNPDFLIYNGDCWNDPSSGDNAKVVMDVLEAFVTQGNHKSLPMKYLMGNHEWRGSFATSMPYLFDAENLDHKSNDLQKQRYESAFTHGNVRIVFMDTGEDGDKRDAQFKSPRERQVAWLKKEIASPAFKKARWRIMVMHIPAWANDWVDSGSQFWREVIRTANPRFDMMLGGHTHYPRIWKADYDRPFPVVIAGGPSPRHAYIQIVANKKTLTAEIHGASNEVLSSVVVDRSEQIYFPTNKQEGIERNVTLSWHSPGRTLKHDVYIGTSRQRVANAKPSSPEHRKRLGNMTKFKPGVLAPGKRYFWRVDELYPRVKKGEVREFVVTDSLLRNGSFEINKLGVQADSSAGLYDLSDGVTKVNNWNVVGSAGRFLVKKQNRYGLGTQATDGLFLLNPSIEKGESGELFTLTQEFQVKPKKEYTVSFDVSYQGGVAADSYLKISVGAKEMKLNSKDLGRAEEFVSKSFKFTSPSRRVKISIISNAKTRNGFYIDNVRVRAK